MQSVLKPLSSDSIVQEYVALSREIRAYQAARTHGGEMRYPAEDAPMLRKMENRRLELRNRLTSPAAGRNDPCPCGSGRKFKRCHGAG